MPVGLNHPAAAVVSREGLRRRRLHRPRRPARRGLPLSTATTRARDRWSRLPDAPTKRAALAVGAIGGRLYAAGGANAADGALATLEIYDIARRRWSRGPSMAKAREHLAGAVAGGAFYVLAGRVTGQGNFKVAERYLPRARRWEQLPDMRKPRGGIGATAVGRRVVVAGGEEATGTIGEVEAYDPATRRWSRLPGMRTPRHGLGVVSRGRRVYTIEGGPTPGFDFANDDRVSRPAALAELGDVRVRVLDPRAQAAPTSVFSFSSRAATARSSERPTVSAAATRASFT